MNDPLSLSLLSLVAASVVSLGAFRIGGRLLTSAPWLVRLGERMHAQKMASLQKPPLNAYQRAVEDGAFGKGFAIIAVLILAKSLASGLLGLIVIFYLPLGVFVMPALAAAHGNDPGMLAWVRQVTAMQCLSHLLAAALGFALTVTWISGDDGLSAVLAANQGLLLGLSVASILTGLLAAFIEVDGHVSRGYL
ncbi:MAG: hypothetical protein AAGE01_13790 [Pseudomonadota bacterium]